MNQRHFPYWPARLPKTLVYPQAPLFDFLETSARRFPAHAAVIYYGRIITYAELWESCQRLAGALAELGVKKGDRVAIYLQNSPHFVISYYGIMRANAVAIPLNPMLVESELSYLLADCGAQVVITTTDLYPRIAAVRGQLGLREVIVGSYLDYLPETPSIPMPDFMSKVPAQVDEGKNWAQVLAESASAPPAEVGSGDLCLLPYTAGSTGVPKGCMHTHATVISNSLSSYHWLSATSSSVSLVTLPLFHVTGMVHSLNAPVIAGGTMVLLTRWDREAALAAIENYCCSHWINITTMVIDLLASPTIGSRDLSSLVAVGGGGAPMPAAVAERLNQVTGLNYVEGYGLTETISQTHFNPPDRAKLQCIGIPDFGVDARIVDVETGRELGVGEEGELVVNGPEVFKGYWNKPEETKEAFMELDGKSFFRTGDICRMDEDGYFYVIDRSKRMINAAGFKVWPAEVEAILYRHPAVAEACVVGVPDPERIENVKAYIVPRPEFKDKVTAQEIIDWSKQQMAAYKYPRLVELVEALPKSGAGKILWRELQQREKELAAQKS